MAGQNSTQKSVDQWPIMQLDFDDTLTIWIEAFLKSRKAAHMAKGTLYYYQAKMKLLMNYMDSQVISRVSQITPTIIRDYLIYLEDTGHNEGGQHQAYRTLKTFLYWFQEENDLDNWKNPIKKVKAPIIPEKEIEPVPLEVVQDLINVCKGSEYTAVRDRALIYFLLDTGCRAFEVCAVNMADVDTISGAVSIKQGKMHKPRSVFLAKKARRALRAYLKMRPSKNPALWQTDDGERLSYWGLNDMIKRRAAKALDDKPGLHDFRRAFCLNYLRNHGDIYSLQRQSGHKSLQVLRKYLAQTESDLQEAHDLASPVENM